MDALKRKKRKMVDKFILGKLRRGCRVRGGSEAESNTKMLEKT